MKKSDMVDELSEQLGVTKVAANAALDRLFGSMANSVVELGTLTIPGVGTLTVKEKPGRDIQLPDGSSHYVPKHQAVKFTTAKRLKEALNQ